MPNILVIEDTLVDQRIVQEILVNSEEKYVVDIAGSGEEAMEIFAQKDFDLVLIDVILPGFDGLETYRQINERIGSKFLPVIFFTEHPKQSLKIKGLHMGAIDYLAKPINRAELKAKVAGSLKIKKIIDDTKWAAEKTNKGIRKLYKDLEQKNKQLAELAEMKSNFTSMVSHELRTPLTAMKSGLKILLGGTAGDVSEEQKEYLELVNRNIERLSRLINNVLDYQKLQADNIEFNLQPGDMNVIATEVYQTMVPLVTEKGLNFNLRLDETIPKANMDEDKVTQVLTNLLNNAIKFTDQGGIELVTQSQNGSVHVMVKDTGVGIAQEEIGKVFESFEQVGGDDKKTGGTGLGLAITKEIVERHQGRIWIESELNKGSNFQFTIPIK